jgi:hypothetical protein
MESIYATGVEAAAKPEPEFEKYAGDVSARFRGASWQLKEGVESDPELRKLLGRIYSSTTAARRLYEAGAFDEHQAGRLADLLAIAPKTIDGLDIALEVTDRWDQLLIEVGDAEYLCTLLEVEYARVDAGTTAVTWKTLYGDRRLKASEAFVKGEQVEDKDLEEARRRLASLYRSRLVLYSLYRARVQMKRNFLLYLAPVLGILVAVFAAAIALTEPGSNWREILLSGAAGAVGATMSGTYKLRDQIDHINALREFKPVMVVQPLLGAAAALFVLLILESGLIQIGDSPLDWATIGAVSFVAGFSEPFVLGVVRRVTGMADEPAK